MIILKSKAELAIMRQAGRMNAEILQAIRNAIRPGVTTMELNRIAERMLKKFGAKSVFKGYTFQGEKPPYPTVINACVNEELVHGIPKKNRRLQAGDLVSIDCGTMYKGYIGDSAFSMGVGKISPEAEKLIEVTKKSLYVGIEQAIAGNRIGDIASTIQNCVESHGFNVVRGYGGHGVGRTMHEDPHVPNHGKPRKGVLLRAGMTFAIEPMVLLGRREVVTLSDQWTVAARDGKLTAHYEHTIAITDNGAEILTLL